MNRKIVMSLILILATPAFGQTPAPPAPSTKPATSASTSTVMTPAEKEMFRRAEQRARERNQTATSETATAQEPVKSTTKDGYIACRTKDDLDLLLLALGANDHGSANTFMKNNRCFLMQGGLKITVVDYPGMFGGTTSFLTNGIKLWTVREALNY